MVNSGEAETAGFKMAGGGAGFKVIKLHKIPTRVPRCVAPSN